MGKSKRSPRPDLIETSHGTVCPCCRLWPDTCTCDPKHPLRRILAGVADELAKVESRS